MWIKVADTAAAARVFARNYTRAGAKRRKAKLDKEDTPTVRFYIEQLGFFDWRVLPEVWKPADDLDPHRPFRLYS